MNPYDWYWEAMSGMKPPIHDGDPQCGYFKIRDRRGLNKNLAPIKRPWIPAAIWLDNGEFRAEICGTEVDIDQAWPWVAKYPIPEEDYRYFYKNERWPE